jgi:hypothetical protein
MKDESKYGKPGPDYTLDPDQECENYYCSSPKEAARYKYCFKCWWDQDPRNVKNGGTVELEADKEFNKMKNVNDLESVQSDGFIENPFSVNNRLILESYKTDRALRSTNSSGFAVVQQKVALKGLKLLVDARISVGDSMYDLPKGSTAYIREEYLHNAQWATKILENEEIEGPFIIVDLVNVEFVKPA